jgi:bifunctional DNA-binding transcriptional regulator/antitoxin component of YhaV-PrlF toxin-antitoxin module
LTESVAIPIIIVLLYHLVILMEYLATITQKGQITLPKAIRELLKVNKYDSVKLVFDKKINKAVIDKAPDLIDMAGTLKIDKRLLKKYPVEKTRELMEQQYGKFEKNTGRF